MGLTVIVESPRPAPGSTPAQRAFATVAEVNRLAAEIQAGNAAFTGALTITNTTDATSKDTGSIITDGGIGVEKAVFVGTSLTATTSVIVDTIAERTAAAGVTVDGVLLKDSSVAVADGTVGNLAVKIGADTNNGIYGVSDTQMGFAVEGVLVGGANTLGLFTDIIAEQTTDTGVTIDQLLIKDNTISNAASITSSGNITSGMFADGVQTITGSGAISVTKGRTEINTTGGGVYTLANGASDGLEKKIYMVVDAGDAVITPTGLLGFTTITMSAVGQGVTLVWSAAQTKWACVGNNGAVLA